MGARFQNRSEKPVFARFSRYLKTGFLSAKIWHFQIVKMATFKPQETELRTQTGLQVQDGQLHPARHGTQVQDSGAEQAPRATARLGLRDRVRGRVCNGYKVDQYFFVNSIDYYKPVKLYICSWLVPYCPNTILKSVKIAKSVECDFG